MVKQAQRMHQSYLPLDIKSQENFIVSKIKQWLGFGHFYKPLFPINKIKEFVQGLVDIKKVELVLYTSMKPKVAEAIISKLQIDKYIAKDRRKYCDL